MQRPQLACAALMMINRDQHKGHSGVDTFNQWKGYVCCMPGWPAHHSSCSAEIDNKVPTVTTRSGSNKALGAACPAGQHINHDAQQILTTKVTAVTSHASSDKALGAACSAGPCISPLPITFLLLA